MRFKKIINKIINFIFGEKYIKENDLIRVKGIDVSSYQGDINWGEVSKTDVKFVIINSIIKDKKLDDRFWKNYNGAKTYGLNVGVYFTSYALDVNSSILDAKNLIDKLNNENVSIWLNLKHIPQCKLGKEKVTEIAKAFVNTCKESGYECNIFSNIDWYKNYYNADILKELGCKFWISKYGLNNGVINIEDKPNLGEYIWQYTNKGRVDGILGNVNMDLKYDE